MVKKWLFLHLVTRGQGPGRMEVGMPRPPRAWGRDVHSVSSLPPYSIGQSTSNSHQTQGEEKKTLPLGGRSSEVLLRRDLAGTVAAVLENDPPQGPLVRRGLG